METPVDVAAKINTISKDLTAEAKKLDELNNANAIAQMEYDKGIGVSEARHKGAGMPVTLIKAQAKKDCADLLYIRIIAEGQLKACYSNIERMKSQLNAQQSIYKHLSVT